MGTACCEALRGTHAEQELTEELNLFPFHASVPLRHHLLSLGQFSHLYNGNFTTHTCRDYGAEKTGMGMLPRGMSLALMSGRPGASPWLCPFLLVCS